MISASHNPYYDNGIKLINSQGEKMGDELIEKIESYLDGKSGEVPFALRDKIAKTVDYVSGRNRYIGYLISLGLYSFKGMRIGLDCANGSAWNIAKSVFEALGASVYIIGAQPDGTNINYMIGSTYMDEICDFVKAKRLDVGFAYDGDADRCLCVDEKGNVVDGDKILYISAKYMKEKELLSGNTVVTTVMSNMGLYKALEKLNINYTQTDVGDRFVYERIKQSGFKLGGEQSGHIIYSKYATTGDGILTSLKVMEIMLSSKRKLSELVSEMKIYPQKIINVEVSDKTAVMTNETVQNELNKAKELLNKEGRVLLRPSGTEPVIRVMVESKNEKLCVSVAQTIAKAIENTIVNN